MSFKILPTRFFLEQLSALDEKSKRIVRSKIELIKVNPYRFKRVRSRLFSKVFRVRLNFGGKETRLIYVVLEPKVILVCFLERSKGYQDLENHLKRIA